MELNLKNRQNHECDVMKEDFFAPDIPLRGHSIYNPTFKKQGGYEALNGTNNFREQGKEGK